MRISSGTSSAPLAISILATLLMTACGPSAGGVDGGNPSDGMVVGAGRCRTNADCTGTAERCFFTEPSTRTPIFECGGLGYCMECSPRGPSDAADRDGGSSTIDAGTTRTVCDCSGHTVDVSTGACSEQPFAHAGPC